MSKIVYLLCWQSKTVPVGLGILEEYRNENTFYALLSLALYLIVHQTPKKLKTHSRLIKEV